MALDAAGLKSEIIALMQAAGFDPLNPAAGGEAEAYIQALATAIVTHIQANGQVIVSGGSSAGTYPVT